MPMQEHIPSGLHSLRGPGKATRYFAFWTLLTGFVSSASAQINDDYSDSAGTVPCAVALQQRTGTTLYVVRGVYSPDRNGDQGHGYSQVRLLAAALATLDHGAEIRVYTASDTVDGTFVTASDTLIVQTAAGRLQIPASDVDAVLEKRYSNRRAIMMFAALGAMTLGTYGYFGRSLYCPYCRGEPTQEERVRAAILGTTSGGIIGAAIGRFKKYGSVTWEKRYP